MKKIISVVCILLCVISLCSCGGKSKTDEIDQKLQIQVEAQVLGEVLFTFGSFDTVSITSKEIVGNTYTVYGIAYFHDNYNEKYSAKFDGVFILTDGEFENHSFHLDKPTKA